MIDTFASAQEQGGTLGAVLGTQRYRLVAADGRYLHMMDLTARTGDQRWAWMGTRSQLNTVRERYPETKGMRAIRVPPPTLNRTAIW